MSETLAKVLVGAFFIVITTSLFIYQVRTTEKMGQNPDPCIEEYKDYCMNEGECFSHVEENIIVFVHHFTEGNAVISSCGGIRNVSLVQNISQLKSDTLQKFQVKIRRVVKFSQKKYDTL